jgi:hypothetical protein
MFEKQLSKITQLIIALNKKGQTALFALDTCFTVRLYRSKQLEAVNEANGNRNNNYS